MYSNRSDVHCSIYSRNCFSQIIPCFAKLFEDRVLKAESYYGRILKRSLKTFIFPDETARGIIDALFPPTATPTSVAGESDDEGREQNIDLGLDRLRKYTFHEVLLPLWTGDKREEYSKVAFQNLPRLVALAARPHIVQRSIKVHFIPF